MQGLKPIKVVLAVMLWGASLCVLASGAAARAAERKQFVPHELLVKFKPGTPLHVRDEIHRGVGATTVGRFPQDERLYHVRVPDGVDVEAALAYYQTCADIQYAQKNLIYHTTETETETIPNDPQFGQQWGWKSTGSSGADVGAIFAWGKAHGRFTVVVASIDTGIDYTHPDLALNIWTNPGEAGGKCYNGVDDDGDGYIDDCRGWNFIADTNDPRDDNGHGTHTSGTIGAMTNNHLGVAGANWDIQIMPLKAFDAWGSGTTELAIRALDYAVAHGATISNNSWGTTGWDPALLDHIKQAEAKGHLLITSAGNGGANNDSAITPFYPCDFTQYDPINNPNPPANIICVAATDQADNLAGFSNYGASTVHLGAPGVGILSPLPGSSYGTLSGTSMATPYVTGGAALLKGCNANLDSATIKSILLGTVRPDGFLTGKTVTGGVVDYQGAINDPRVGNCDTAPSNSLPVANAGGPYKTSFKKAVQFDGTHSYDSGGEVLLYFWDFGDGTFGAGAKPTHHYAARGTFTVVLTVRDSLGAVASQSTTVIIPPASHN